VCNLARKVHARKHNPWADRDELLHRCRGARHNHLCQFLWLPLRGFRRSGCQILGFSIDLHRRSYNTLALPCECVIIITRLCSEGANLRQGADCKQELMEGCFYFPSVLPLPSIPLFSLSFPSPTPSISHSSPFLSLPPLSLSFPSLPLLSPPLKSRAPLNQLGGLGSAVSFSSGIRGRAPAENEFGAL